MPIKLVVNAAPSAVENPDGGSVWKKKFSLISYSAVAGGRELVELCPAAMPAHNTSNGVILFLGTPKAAKLEIMLQEFMAKHMFIIQQKISGYQKPV